MQSHSDISVVICTYSEDRWCDLLAAVESVRQQTLPALEIIVVVDHNPALLERVTGSIPGVLVMQSVALPGLAGSRNSGLSVARGTVVAFLDDDALPEPDWLERLSAGYAEPHVLGIGGSIAPMWSTNRPRWFPEEFDWVVGCTYRGMPQAKATVRNLIGCNMSFRRDVLIAAGGFRDRIGRIGTRPLGCEETEFCIRAGQLWPRDNFVYDPAALVHHRVAAPRARWKYFLARCYAEGISKALISRLVGATDALASERAHVLRTLPRAAFRGIVDALVRRDLAGFARAAAIALGLGAATSGYLIGRISTHATARFDIGQHGLNPLTRETAG